MSISVALFLICVLPATAFLFATMGLESNIPWSSFRQVGDTSLGRNSVNWMAVIALAAALMICFFLT